MSRFEIHFTEGFTGQSARIDMGGQTLAQSTLKSEFQTGLAHIETIDADDGQAVTLRIEGVPDTTVNLNAAEPFVVVTMEGGEARIAMAAVRPGYV